jgi:hypothetical protein
MPIRTALPGRKVKMQPTKHELVGALMEIADLYPTWRMAQLVVNVAAWAGESEPANVWDVTDEQLLAAAREHLKRRSVETSAMHR